MKCFQTIQEKIAMMGLIRKQHPNNRPQWNPRQLFCTAFYVGDTMTMGAYVMFEAQDIEEYMEAIFSLTAVLGLEVAYINLIFKNDQLFNVFELVSKELTTSK